VVITGWGVFASTGKDVESFFSNLANARLGVRRITQWDPSSLSVQIAAEVPDYSPTGHFPPKRLDLLDRFTQFGLLAASQAMQSSGIEVSEEEKLRFGVVMGSGMGGAGTFDSGCFNLYAKHETRLHPFTIPKIMHNAVTSQICLEYGAQGPSLRFRRPAPLPGTRLGRPIT
jgi:nodulation protein E